MQDIPAALAPLVDFAKEILKDYEKDWKRFPIYLKATAGMRQLSYEDREAVLAAVRDYLGDPETCPFYFQFDHARVISGEEVRAFAGRGLCVRSPFFYAGGHVEDVGDARGARERERAF